MLWLRALVVYPFTILLFRFMGRGLSFQSRPYDTVVQVLLGSAAANLIIQQNIELWKAFTALGTLALIHTGISFLSLWNPAKRFLVGQPTVVIENGQILRANLLKHQITVDELIGTLREKGYHSLPDIEMAMLEASGKLSVIPVSQKRPVTPADLNLDTKYEALGSMLISDGTVDQQNLKKLGLAPSWLQDQLAARGIESINAVLFASLDTQGELFVVRDQDVPFLQAIFKGVQTQTSPGLPPMVGKGSRPH
jgi:uncharacterized membrane protein YcaP (DUF421 family)